MNYHIITQDKFFDAYIEDIYKVNNGSNNIFWVRGKEGESSLLRTKRKVEYLGKDNPENLIRKLRSMQPNDRLFISWYDMYIGQAILDSGITNDIYVWVMGGDFYAEPFWYHASWLYDKYTLKFIKSKKEYGYPQVNWKRMPKNWSKIFDELKIKWNFQAEQQKLYEIKLKTIQRINFLIMSEYWISEFNRVKELYPGCTFRRVSAAFDQNFDTASRLITPTENGNGIKILVGNSADPTNNYVDAYKYIKNSIRGTYEIYSILSYGDSINRDYVLQIGRKIFGDAYHPVTEFMDRRTYIEFLNSMDVVVMYHNRQQACGNIMTVVTLGKPVFMKACSPIYTMLKEQGCSSVYDVKKVNFENLEEIIQSANRDRANNVAIVKKIYSEETRLNNWRELLKEG